MGIRDRADKSAPVRRVIVALVACGAVALSAAHSGAQSIDSLNSKLEEAKREAQALAAQIDSATARLAAAQEQAIAAAQREAELNAVLAKGEAKERRLEAAVAESQRQLAAARRQLGRSRNALSDRLVGIYRSGMPDAVTLILEADAFLVARVRTMRNEVSKRLTAVEDAEARAQAHNEQVTAARDGIAQVRADAEAQAAALADLRAERQAAIETLQSRVGEWTEEVQRLERISARQAQSEVASWFGDWAIPYAIVMCESGGDFTAVNPTSGAGGAYQILPSTWHLYGGEGLPQDASPQEQSEIAAQIWADSGGSAWECAG